MSSRPPLLRLWLWRARVPLTALTLLTCAAVVVGFLRPSPEPHTAVVVASRSIEAGEVIGVGDARRVSWPRRLAPEGAQDAVVGVTGRTLAVSVPAGMPLVTGVLADDALWSDAPSGAVAAPVRLSDAEFASMLRPGDRVDVLAVAHEGGTAQRLARGALVLRGPVREELAEGGLFGGAAPTASGLILLAVTPKESASLAEHSATSVVVAVLVQ